VELAADCEGGRSGHEDAPAQAAFSVKSCASPNTYTVLEVRLYFALLFLMALVGCSRSTTEVCAVDSLVEPQSREVCGDGLDNDRNGLMDCADDRCEDADGCDGEWGQGCIDGLDGDQDGLADCADSDCAAHHLCAELIEWSCSNGLDGDEDGLTDCDDSDCATLWECDGVEDRCDDELDEDRDGLIDCDDPDCAAICTRNEEDCSDGLAHDSGFRNAGAWRADSRGRGHGASLATSRAGVELATDCGGGRGGGEDAVGEATSIDLSGVNTVIAVVSLVPSAH